MADPPAAQGPAPPGAAGVPPAGEEPAGEGARGSQPDRALAEELLQQGLDLHDRQEFEKALACYRQAVAAAPDFAPAHHNVGLALTDLNRYAEALQAFGRTIRLDPDDPEPYSSAGFVLRRMRQDAQAAAAYAEFLERAPESEDAPRIRLWVGKVKAEQGLVELPPLRLGDEDAGAAAPGAAGVTPAGDQPTGEDARGAGPVTIPGAAGVTPAGEKSAGGSPAAPPEPEPRLTAPPPPRPAGVSAPSHRDAAPSLPAPPPPPTRVPAVLNSEFGLPPTSPDEPGPPAPRAGTAGRLPDGSAGTADEEKVIQLIERGYDLLAEANPELAGTAFRQAVELDPDSAEAHEGLGKVLVRQELCTQGIAELQEAIALNPAAPAPYYVLGFVQRAERRDAEAAAAYEKFLELLPGAEEAGKIRQWLGLFRQGQALTETRAVPAVTDVKTGAESDAGTVPIKTGTAAEAGTDKRYQEALRLFQDGNFDGALGLCVRTLRQDPAHARMRALLGRLYLRQKQPEEAIEQLEGALSGLPDDPEVLYFLGQAYEKKGHLQKAREAYATVLQLVPEGARADRLREWLAAQEGPPETERQVQCELCLRSFPEAEVTVHDGVKTCRGCLVLIGGAAAVPGSAALPPRAIPETVTPDLEAAPWPVQASQLRSGPPGRRRRRGLVLVCAGMMVLSLTYLGFQTIWRPKPPRPPIFELPPPLVPPTPFDASKVSWECNPSREVLPLARWSYTPGLKVSDAPAGVRLVFALKQSPPGMTVDPQTGDLGWTPPFPSPQELAQGVTYPVEVALTACQPVEAGAAVPPVPGGEGGKALPPVPGKEGAATTPKVLFTLTRSFQLHCQYRLDPGPELSLGVAADERIVCALGNFGGDGAPALALAQGDYGTGKLSYYLHVAVPPLANPLTFDMRGWTAALQRVDLNGDGRDDLLAVNGCTGQVRFFVQDERHQPAPGPSFVAGRGPVAGAVADVDGDGKPEVAVLLGLGQALVACRYEGGLQFTPLTTVPLPTGGASGWVLPWRSRERGPGFVAVVPPAKRPLCFVPWKDSALGPPTASPLTQSGVIVGAAVLHTKPQAGTEANGPGVLALLTSGRGSRISLWQEREGRFEPAAGETGLEFDELGLNLLAVDWNLDGREDVAVVFRSGLRLYFRQAGGLVEGPRLTALGPLSGFAAAADLNRDGRPDLLVWTEDGRARLLLSSLGGSETRPYTSLGGSETRPHTSGLPIPSGPAAEAAVSGGNKAVVDEPRPTPGEAR